MKKGILFFPFALIICSSCFSGESNPRIVALKEAFTQKPTDISTIYALASALTAAGRKDEAMPLYKLASNTKLQPPNFPPAGEMSKNKPPTSKSF